jgi:SpoVK/Ycf46/Vps4 family AAA+-type ATPase
MKPLKAAINRWELPPGSSPRIMLAPVHEIRTGEVTSWMPAWYECPVAVWLVGLSAPVIVVNVPYTSPAQGLSSEWKNWVICRRSSLADLMTVMAEVCSAHRREVTVLGGPAQLLEDESDVWDDLILDPELHRLVRKDFESFFAREEWFRKHRLPFKRGYLFYGPPGNGKTSVIRAMANRPGLSLFSVNFNSEDVSDFEVMELLDQARRRAPALLVLEDLDRILPRESGKEPKVQVSLSGFLNSLDGLVVQQGVIIVATANESSQLDPAIINRPGRFDRVIEFQNPGPAVRAKYFQKIGGLAEEESTTMIDPTNGFSFAQMKETYILAGQLAFEEERDITIFDLQQATAVMRDQSMNARSVRGAKPGFCAEENKPKTRIS